MNQLFYGDNLEVMRERIPDEVAELVYLDPPFNSSRSYNLLFKQVRGDPSLAQIHAFEDTWNWSPRLYEEFKADRRNARLFELVEALYRILGASEMMAYVLMMAPRLLELHRKLKNTGSLYLHCDPTASHYLKLVLDIVFGTGGFRNEVVWRRTPFKGSSKARARQYPRSHDVLLFYARSEGHAWNAPTVPYGPEYLKRFKWQDARGCYRKTLLKTYSKATLDRLKVEDRLIEPVRPGAMYSYKQYLHESPGVSQIDDVWTDINMINPVARERRGYPTQKPLALLERIIAASSNEGDVVMDPFCGCGTALVAAERMGRKWIGIDITYLAINEVIHRLKTECAEGRPLDYELIGSPKDAGGAEQLFRSTAGQNHKPFEQWCVTLVGGEYRDRGGADRGVDGVIPIWGFDGALHKIVIQVKGGQALTLSAVRDFASVIKDNKALLGLMISMKDPTREMQLVCEQQGYADWPAEKKYPRLQIRTVKDLLEDPHEPFEIPDHARVPRQEGVGRRARSQLELFQE